MRYLLALLASSAIALAEEPPSEAHKIWALKRAYELNGNSMVRLPQPGIAWESIDLSKETPPKPVKTIPVPPLKSKGKP